MSVFTTAVIFLFVYSCVAKLPSEVINIRGQGKISGVEKSKLRVQKIVAYYGIPYAQPPVDMLRFTPPVTDPLPSWSDVMRNTEYPPSCFQSEADYKNSEKPFLQLISNLSFALQEDCLYLNVFAPMVDDPKGLPTVIWFHPGDFATGSPIMWDPHTVVYRQKVIVVTVAYRLNIFGFFTTMDGEATGNYGLMDQQAAMQWVKRNIEDFGGNPNNICIMGYGAGATSIAIHLINPASKGLFNKAIALSGKYFSANVVKLPEESKSLLDELSSNFGCDRKPTSRLINCLRGIEPDILIKPTFDFNWGPTIDVDITNSTPFLTDYPIRYFERGDFEKVPLMTGYTSMEHIMDIEGLKNITSVSTEDLRSLLADLLSDEISAVNYTESTCAHNYDHLVDAVMFFYLPMTPVDDPDKFRSVITNFLAEKYYAASSYLLASFMSKYNYTYVYRSDIRPSTDNATMHLPKWVSVPHLFDLIYIWGVPYWSNGQEWHKRDKSISDIIMALWTNFVKYSDPTQYPVEWSNFTEQNPGILINVNGTFKMSDSRDVNYKAFEFWNQYFPKVKAIVSQCCEALENTSSVISYNLSILYPLLVTSIFNVLRYL
nr:unnamed protein product [Callosobruchus chinensis]